MNKKNIDNTMFAVCLAGAHTFEMNKKGKIKECRTCGTIRPQTVEDLIKVFKDNKIPKKDIMQAVNDMLTMIEDKQMDMPMPILASYKWYANYIWDIAPLLWKESAIFTNVITQFFSKKVGDVYKEHKVEMPFEDPFTSKMYNCKNCNAVNATGLNCMNCGEVYNANNV